MRIRAAETAPLSTIAGSKGAVGAYRSPFTFSGIIDEVRVYYGNVADAEAQARFADPTSSPKDASPKQPSLVMYVRTPS